MDIGDSYAAQATRISEEGLDWSKYPKKLNISSRAFYANFHGHHLHYLVALERLLRGERSERCVIWLAGDSSLDNKHWQYPDPDKKMENSLNDDSFSGPALNGYETVLRDPCRSVRDVAYWINEAAANDGGRHVCINTAVEASTLKDRMTGLLGHDMLIRDKMQPQDSLIVSIGGNDIALRPSVRTMLSVSWLTFFSSEANITSSTAYGMGQIKQLFYENLKKYLEALTAKTKPKKLLVCMIYYPCESGDGWADPLLNLLGYNADGNPAKVRKIQLLLDTAFRECIQKLEIPGTQVIPIALSKVLDSTNSEHYENRVEPSVIGGMLMGQTFYQAIAQDHMVDAQIQSIDI